MDCLAAGQTATRHDLSEFRAASDQRLPGCRDIVRPEADLWRTPAYARGTVVKRDHAAAGIEYFPTPFILQHRQTQDVAIKRHHFRHVAGEEDDSPHRQLHRQHLRRCNEPERHNQIYFLDASAG